MQGNTWGKISCNEKQYLSWPITLKKKTFRPLCVGLKNYISRRLVKKKFLPKSNHPYPPPTTTSKVKWLSSYHGCLVHFVYNANRPFYRYSGHIELIRFKEYYRMPREHEHISFVFASAFRDIFS